MGEVKDQFEREIQAAFELLSLSLIFVLMEFQTPLGIPMMVGSVVFRGSLSTTAS
jgi:hypothetical protein